MFELATFIANFFKLPIPPHKKEWIKVFDDMSVHTRKRKPFELLLNRRPNEEEHIFNYRMANYEPITYGSMNKALDELYRIVNSINYKVNVPDGLHTYIADNNFDGFSLELFLQKIVLKRMIEDPNGLLCWLPDGLGLTDSSKKVVPQPYLVYSSDIIYQDKDIVAFISNEKSLVKVGAKQVYEGDVYYILTDSEFYKLIQIGLKSDKKFQLELIYEFAGGAIPAVKLGGDMTANGFYESFFAPYLAFGNEAIRQFSDWQAIMVTSSFPYIEEFEVVATEEDREPSKLSSPIPPTEEKFKPQQILKIIPKTPYGVTRRAVPSSSDSWTAVLDPAIPSRRYIHPDISIAKYAGEAWNMLINKAEDALQLNLGDGVMSGVAKKISKQSQDSLITKIGNNFFDNIYQNALVFIDCQYNNHPVDRSITIDKPSTFQIKTEQDLIEELTVLRDKDVPTFFMNAATTDLAAKRFSGNKFQQKLFDVITQIDPLNIYSTADKSQLLLSNVINKADYIRSVYIYSLLIRIAGKVTQDAFINMSIDNIEKLLVAALAPVLAGMGETQLFDAKGNPIGKGQNTNFNPDDTVTIAAGQEQDTSHAGLPFTINTVTGNNVLLNMANGTPVNGYSLNDLAVYNG